MSTLEEALPAVASFCQRYGSNKDYAARFLLGIKANNRLIQDAIEELFRVLGADLRQGTPGYYSFFPDSTSARVTSAQINMILQKYKREDDDDDDDDDNNNISRSPSRSTSRQRPRFFQRGVDNSRTHQPPLATSPRQQRLPPHQRKLTDEELAVKLAEEGSDFLQDYDAAFNTPSEPMTQSGRIRMDEDFALRLAEEDSSPSIFAPPSSTSRCPSVQQESDEELAMRVAKEESLSYSLHHECPESVLSLLREKLFGLTPIGMETAKSAQQSVLILEYSPNAIEERFHQQRALSSLWYDCLVSGNYKLVTRLWKGGSRWWNLNRQRPPTSSSSSSQISELSTQEQKAHVVQDLARSEIAGYQIAHSALGNKIPRLLHCYHCDELEQSQGSFYSWAIFEFVGPQSRHFREPQSSFPSPPEYDSHWTDTMIKLRQEFGFPEPHPRWGRVPAEHALEYAKTVVREVTIPLHQWFYSQQSRGGLVVAQSLLRDLVLNGTKREPTLADESQQSPVVGYTYESMVQVHKEAHGDMESLLQSTTASEPKLVRCVHTLGLCIQQLKQDCEIDGAQYLKHLPFVLVHMDCQPQNLIFAKSSVDGMSHLNVSSVLDWEEAAYADPRFELLLLGRKVCANLEQAESLWQFYESHAWEEGTRVELGPIAPWLRLETVHSLCTLLLQSMKQGGRSPWENKPELWGKIVREFQRLVASGWAFCAEI